MADRTCAICDRPLSVTWTDTHGVAACLACNAAYRIIHREDGRVIDKPPELLVREAWVPLLRRYWQEAGRRYRNGFNFPGSDYEQCSRDDAEAFNAWCDAHESELPPPVVRAESATVAATEE